MILSPQRFNRQLAEMGQAMLWQRAHVCPCTESHSGSARPDCPVCDGRGFFWSAPVLSRAGVVGARARRQFDAFGRWEDGDVMISIPGNTPLWGAGENDRVVFADGHQPFQQHLVNDGTARLRFSVVRIDRCFWLGPQGESVVECSVPRLDRATGALSWSDPATAPDPGAQFVISGTKRPEYFLWRELPISRAHFNGLDLPKRAVLKKFDLFGR